MPDFSTRSLVPELMDNFSMPQTDLNTNLLELEVINRWLGGYAVSFDGIKKLNLPKGETITIADIGCGGGDGMIAIQKYCRRLGVRVRMIGIDANPKAIEYARTRCINHPEFDWVVKPFQDLNGLEADVFHCSLFAHHFYKEDLGALVNLMQRARIGFIINDLHRNWLAYHSISLLTRLFSKSYLVQNDARLSVAKGFSKRELENLFSAVDLRQLDIHWKWAFRWQVIGKVKT